jgi:hypothetical protein
MTITEASWTRDGETFVNSGELDGQDPPSWGIEIDGDYYTAYYRKGGEARAATTYYVVKCLTTNQPSVVEAWVIEEATWVGSPLDGDDCPLDADYMYDSASALFYDTPGAAHRIAHSMADSDESYAFT